VSTPYCRMICSTSCAACWSNTEPSTPSSDRWTPKSLEPAGATRTMQEVTAVVVMFLLHQTVLYGIVREHLATFLAYTESIYTAPLPRYVVEPFEHDLGCGDLARGFLRCHGDDCGPDVLVAFSCKARGICPSCGTRRMCNEAAQRVDRVLPNAPLRQWVLSLPFDLRGLAATKPDVLGAMDRIFAEEIERLAVIPWLRRPLSSPFAAPGGGVRCVAKGRASRRGSARPCSS
jgi:hypothetical protein